MPMLMDDFFGSDMTSLPVNEVESELCSLIEGFKESRLKQLDIIAEVQALQGDAGANKELIDQKLEKLAVNARKNYQDQLSVIEKLDLLDEQMNEILGLDIPQRLEDFIQRTQRGITNIHQQLASFNDKSVIQGMSDVIDKINNLALDNQYINQLTQTLTNSLNQGADQFQQQLKIETENVDNRRQQLKIQFESLSNLELRAQIESILASLQDTFATMNHTKDAYTRQISEIDTQFNSLMHNLQSVLIGNPSALPIEKIESVRNGLTNLKERLTVLKLDGMYDLVGGFARMVQEKELLENALQEMEGEYDYLTELLQDSQLSFQKAQQTKENLAEVKQQIALITEDILGISVHIEQDIENLNKQMDEPEPVHSILPASEFQQFVRGLLQKIDEDNQKLLEKLEAIQNRGVSEAEAGILERLREQLEGSRQIAEDIQYKLDMTLYKIQQQYHNDKDNADTSRTISRQFDQAINIKTPDYPSAHISDETMFMNEDVIQYIYHSLQKLQEQQGRYMQQINILYDTESNISERLALDSQLIKELQNKVQQQQEEIGAISEKRHSEQLEFQEAIQNLSFKIQQQDHDLEENQNRHETYINQTILALKDLDLTFQAIVENFTKLPEEFTKLLPYMAEDSGLSNGLGEIDTPNSIEEARDNFGKMLRILQNLYKKIQSILNNSGYLEKVNEIYAMILKFNSEDIGLVEKMLQSMIEPMPDLQEYSRVQELQDARKVDWAASCSYSLAIERIQSILQCIVPNRLEIGRIQAELVKSLCSELLLKKGLVVTMNSRLDTITLQLGESQKAVQQYEQQLKEANQKQSELEDMLQQQNQNEELQSALDVNLQLTQQQQEQLGEVKRQLYTLENEIDDLSQNYQNLLKSAIQRDKLRKYQEKFSKLTRNSQEDPKTITERLIAKAKILFAYQKCVREALSQASAEKRRLQQEMRQEVEKLNETIYQQKIQINEFTREVMLKTEEITQLKQEIETLQQQFNSEHDEKRHWIQEYDKTQMKYIELEQQNKNLQSECQELEYENDEKLQRIKDLMKKLKDSNQPHAIRNSGSGKFAQEKEMLERKILQIQQDLAQKAEMLKEEKEANFALKRELSEIQVEAESLNNRLSLMSSENNDLRQKAVQQDLQINQLRSENHYNSANTNALEAKIKETQQEYQKIVNEQLKQKNYEQLYMFFTKEVSAYIEEIQDKLEPNMDDPLVQSVWTRVVKIQGMLQENYWVAEDINEQLGENSHSLVYELKNRVTIQRSLIMANTRLTNIKAKGFQMWVQALSPRKGLLQKIYNEELSIQNPIVRTLYFYRPEANQAMRLEEMQIIVEQFFEVLPEEEALAEINERQVRSTSALLLAFFKQQYQNQYEISHILAQFLKTLDASSQTNLFSLLLLDLLNFNNQHRIDQGIAIAYANNHYKSLLSSAETDITLSKLIEFCSQLFRNYNEFNKKLLYSLHPTEYDLQDYKQLIDGSSDSISQAITEPSIPRSLFLYRLLLLMREHHDIPFKSLLKDPAQHKSLKMRLQTEDSVLQDTSLSYIQEDGFDERINSPLRDFPAVPNRRRARMMTEPSMYLRDEATANRSKVKRR